jgi:hypothetical protein
MTGRPYAYEDLICGNKFKAAYRGMRPYYADSYQVEARVPTTAECIVTHNGDRAITPDLVARYPRLKCWFGQNIECNDPRVHPLPIGLENDYNPGQPAKNQRLFELAAAGIAPTKLAYLNCSIWTFPPDRQPAYAYFGQQPWCTARQHDAEARGIQGSSGFEGYEAFCRELLEHQFVIAPRGHGLDCHRSWEALYLRRWPVMKRYPGLVRVFEGLPVAWVDDWSEVTPAFLVAEQRRLGGIRDRARLTMAYWLKYIAGTIRKCLQ